jgi:hypothetical protein
MPWSIRCGSAVGALLIAGLISRLALGIARLLPKRSLAQVFILVASALLAVGIARMLAVPVFLTLFLMGVLLAQFDRAADPALHRAARRPLAARHHPLRHRRRLAAVAGFHLAHRSAGDRPAARTRGGQGGALAASGGRLPLPKRLLVAIGIQPLSATAIFMAYEIAGLYPEIGRSALALSLFAAAVMELAGPALCRFALRRSGETENRETGKGRHRMSTALGEFRHSEP